MIQKTTLAVLLFALFASVFAAGAFSVSEPPSDSAALPADAHMRVTLSGEEQRFTFSPAANSVYSVYFFPDGEDRFAEARLYRNGTLLASGGGSLRLFEANLSAGENYELAISGAGGGRLEVMRATLGRCFEKPIELRRARSTTKNCWCAPATPIGTPSPPARAARLPSTPRPTGDQAQDLALSGLLMDAAGHVLHEAGSGAGGFVIDCELTAGARYYVRVSALNDSTGPYRLAVEQDTARAARPEAVSLSAEELSMNIGETQTLSAVVSPQDAHPTVTFTSSDRRRGHRFANGRGLRRGRGRGRDHREGLGRGQRLLHGARGGRAPLGHRFSQSALTLARGRAGAHGVWKFYPQGALPTGA